MKYVVDTILKRIGEQGVSGDDQVRIRLSGFEDVRIYESVCSRLHERYDSYVKVETRLAGEKWNAFLASGTSSQAHLNAMEAQGWIAKDTSLTYYRNLPQSEAQLIVLMGTEAVKDQGGLSDCYYIDPERIKADLAGAFHRLLPCGYGEWSKTDAEVIDRLFHDLFVYVPLNICLLSDRVDSWPVFSSLDEFAEHFFKQLPVWGLCKEGLRAKLQTSKLRKAGKKNLFQENWEFVTRASFAKLSKKKYESTLDKLNLYKDDPNSDYGPAWEEWASSPFGSYDAYAAVLRDYISGIRMEQCRQQLLQMDLDVARDILNLKTSTSGSGTGPKPKVIKLRGAPLSVFSQAILIALTDTDKKDREFNEIHIKINDVEMADAVDAQLGEDENQQLLNGWKQVCYHAGGVIEYIRRNEFVLQGQDDPIDITYSPEKVFSPSKASANIVSGLVGFASGAKKLDKVSFQIDRMMNGSWNKLRFQFEWTFSLDEPWCVAFSELCNAYYQLPQEHSTALVPLVTVDNFDALMHSRAEDEFLDALEQSNFRFDFNLASEYASQYLYSGSNASSWIYEYNNLGTAFLRFCDAIANRGFYSDLASAVDGNSQINVFLDCYQKLGNKIINSSFTQTMAWVMDGFIHAFAIESNTNPIKTGERNNACIIPPYHPAVLQKLADQARFLMDGCVEWLKQRNQKDKVDAAVDDLYQLSQIQEGVDIFPGASQGYFGAIHAFANYCLCGSKVADAQTRVRTILQKDAVFDEGFNDTQYKQMNRNAQMLYDVIESYVQSLPAAGDNLSVAVIDPDDLQPIIAAVHKHITKQKEKGNTQATIRVVLNILVRPENRGGRNYLSYWADTFFSEDENVDVKIYLNVWETADELKRQLPQNLDLLFLMDVLKVDKLDFIRDTDNRNVPPMDCRFPIVYKPTPPGKGQVNRRIELTQRQFGAPTVHSQVVYYRDNYEQYQYKPQIAVRNISISANQQKLISELHEKSNWIVCVDSGMDGALLRREGAHDVPYDVIGYSTGKGSHGQYNLTITARESLIAAVQRHVEADLRRSFHWDDATIAKAAVNCMAEAKKLDGIGLLSAVNAGQFSFKRVNEFLAYILTAYQERKRWEESGAEGLNVLVRLDSYCHWFSGEEKLDEEQKSYRPDFLSIQADVGADGKLNLHATVIECKIATIQQRDAHASKAVQQANYGIGVLRRRFDPNSESIRRRFWFAQLYRTLAFSQITFQSDSRDYDKLAAAMRRILDGDFEIHWSAKAMLYWKDWNIEDERISMDDLGLGIELHEIPQKAIQRLLMQDNSFEAEFSEVPPDEPPVSEQEEWKEIRELANKPANRRIQESFVERKAEEKSKESFAEREPGTQNEKTPKEQEMGDAGNEDSRSSAKTEVRPVEEKSEVETVAPQSKEDKPKLEKDNKHEPQVRTLSDVRVNIGKDRAGNGVYWEFGNRHLANRHLLITGTSGQGKTYSIQTMLKELAEAGVSSAIFDYTEGFRKEQLEPEFRESLNDKIIEHVVYFEGIPIDPFRRQEIEISGHKGPEKISDVAQRLAAIFTHVYGFGPQQFSAIYEACQSGLEKYGDSMSFSRFKEMLEASKNSSAKTVLSKMGPFFGSVEFRPEQSFDWNSVTQSNGTVTIFQLTSYVREIQVIITELMLWDAWHYFKKYGNKDTPFVVVLDEAQNLSMDSNSPAEVILREGRKFGWSAWFATQSLKPLNDAEIVNLHQAPFALYFRPTDDEIVKIAKQIDPAGGGSEWINPLKSLRKGQCIVVGDRIRGDGKFGHVRPTVTSVTSFRERMNASTE